MVYVTSCLFRWLLGVLVSVVCVPRSLLVLCRLVVNLEEVKVIYGQNSCL